MPVYTISKRSKNLKKKKTLLNRGQLQRIRESFLYFRLERSLSKFGVHSLFTKNLLKFIELIVDNVNYWNYNHLNEFS